MREREERASAGPVRGRWPKRKRRAGRGRLGLRAGVGRSVSGQKGEGSRPARASGLREEKEKQALGPNKRKRERTGPAEGEGEIGRASPIRSNRRERKRGLLLFLFLIPFSFLNSKQIQI